MNAQDILNALRAHYPRAAFVPELTIDAGNHGDVDAWLKAIKEAGLRGEPYNVPRPSETRRIDALMFDGPQRTAIEIKVSLADLRRENYQKVAPWNNVVHRFVYAVPAGLIDNGPDLPTYYAGLWWVHENGRVEVRRKAKINRYPEELPRRVVTNLAYRAAGNTQLT